MKKRFTEKHIQSIYYFHTKTTVNFPLKIRFFRGNLNGKSISIIIVFKYKGSRNDF